MGERRQSEQWPGYELISRLQWSEPVPLARGGYKKMVPEQCGVYRLRLVDCKAEVIPVERFAGIDGGGILYIGGTTSGGPLRDRFSRHLRGHSDGMRGKTDKNGNVQNLVHFWHDIRLLCPNAGLTFEYAVLRDRTEAMVMECLLHAEYAAVYGEIPESGEKAPWPIHNAKHPWREKTRNGELERCGCER